MTAETADIAFGTCRGMEVMGSAVPAAKREALILKRKKKRDEEEELELEENFTHMCKICKKKFVSGRAFGGHMRIHGPVATAHAAAEHGEKLGAANEFQKKRCRVPHGDDVRGAKSAEAEQQQEEDEDEEGEEEGEGGFDVNHSNPIYALRRHPKRSWRLADRDYSFLMADDADVSDSRGFGHSAPVRSSHGCEACGKNFSSWKALFAHAKCHSDPLWTTRWDEDDDLDENWEYSQRSESSDEEEEEVAEEEPAAAGAATDGESDNEIEQRPSGHRPAANSRRFEQWMKGKRSKRPRYALQPHPQPARPVQSCSGNSEEEDMAMCLVMLSSGVNAKEAEDPKFGGAEDCGGCGSRAVGAAGAEGNASELQKCVPKKPRAKRTDTDVGPSGDPETRKISYECNTCNKVFHSHQALGGHRASHRRVKGCSSRADLEEENESLEEEITEEELVTGSDLRFHRPAPKDRRARDGFGEESAAAAGCNKKSRLHECSICHRVFPTGQALGGHKRCHWGTGGASETTSTVSSTKDAPVQVLKQAQKPVKGEPLDLNLPASVEDECCTGMEDATHPNHLGATVVDSRRPSSRDVEARTKIGPPCLPPWWISGFPRQGLFLYNGQPHLAPDDEADSKLGSKIGLGMARDSAFQGRAQPWLQLGAQGAGIGR